MSIYLYIMYTKQVTFQGLERHLPVYAIIATAQRLQLR